MQKVDIALNESCRCITGCIRSRNIDSLYILAGIAPTMIRRTVASRKERSGQIEDPRHPYIDTAQPDNDCNPGIVS